MARNTPNAEVLIETMSVDVSVESALVSFCAERNPAVLESAANDGQEGRYSILAFDPVQVLTLGCERDSNPLNALADEVRRCPSIEPRPTNLPFLGGWIGFISYEAGLATEGIHSNKSQCLPGPAVRFCLYDSAAVFDHLENEWSLTAVDWPTGVFPGRSSARTRLENVRDTLRSSSSRNPDAPSSLPPLSSSAPHANLSESRYHFIVESAKRLIQAGDIYQVNLTQRFSAMCDAPPIDLYRRLRWYNPGAYAAMLTWDDHAVLSSSPELFLNLRDGHVRTRPIKGTRPRGASPSIDERYRCELGTSPKDRAELNMIVDLMRNDLGRVCEYGTVRVVDAGRIEKHPTVYHRVATIEGRLRPEHDWADLLRATFPGGSITGAPKIRSMQIIDELEPTPRGVFCGAIGMIGLDGSMSMNIAIRTMIQVSGHVHLYAGGAIVADSDVDDEYRELLAKARGMFQALGCEEPAFESTLSGATVS